MLVVEELQGLVPGLRALDAPLTNAARITVSVLRKRLGEPWIIATVPGAGYGIDIAPDDGGGADGDG